LINRYIPRGALLLATLTFLTYAMGLLRDRVFARTFGLSRELDAYNAAFILPELALDVLIASGLTAPFVPIFLGLGRAGELRSDERRLAVRFGQTILSLAVVVMAATALLLFVFAPATADLIVPGFTDQEQALYVELFRIMLITPVLFAASIALGEILVAERRFLWYGLAGLLYNAGIVVGTVLLSSSIGIHAAAWGAVLGAAAHLGIRVVGALRAGFVIRPRLEVRTAAVAEFIRLMVPKMLSHPIEPLTFLYFTALATTFAAGDVTAVSFARNFQSLPVSLIGIAFSIAAFPALATAAADGDRARFVRLVRVNAITIAALASAAAIGLIVVGGFAIRLFLGGGEFGDDDVARTTLLLSAFAIAIPFESLVYLFSRAVYATRNTLLAVLASVAGFLVTIVTGELLAGPLGVVAIPASFTIGSVVKVALLMAATARRVRTVGPGAGPALSAASSAPRR
jgi:putative peptidoglycan lipid II flippase